MPTRDFGSALVGAFVGFGLGAISAIVAIQHIPKPSGEVTVGLLTIGGTIGGAVVGALITGYVGVARERSARDNQSRDTATVLYHELLDRAWRCCFNYRDTWSSYERPNIPDKPMNFERLRKFSPTLPVVYPSLAGQLALVPTDALSALIRFYFALDAWRRDIDRYVEHPSKDRLESGQYHLMAQRLGETLTPALMAVETLRKHVPDAERIEDEFAKIHHLSSGQMLKTLQELSEQADQARQKRIEARQEEDKIDGPE